jgi:hypothetical protein
MVSTVLFLLLPTKRADYQQDWHATNFSLRLFRFLVKMAVVESYHLQARCGQFILTGL